MKYYHYEMLINWILHKIVHVHQLKRLKRILNYKTYNFKPTLPNQQNPASPLPPPPAVERGCLGGAQLREPSSPTVKLKEIMYLKYHIFTIFHRAIRSRSDFTDITYA